MAKKPFPFSVCAECCGSGTDGYSKTEVDSKLRVINDELQRLDANVRDIQLSLTNVYNKTEVNDIILNEREYLINGYYNKDETSAMIEAAIGTALEGEY